MFKNRIDFWMEEKGVKNKRLAKICNVTETTFSKWRKNKTQPDLKSAVLISKELQIKVDDLYEWEEDQ